MERDKKCVEELSSWGWFLKTRKNVFCVFMNYYILLFFFGCVCFFCLLINAFEDFVSKRVYQIAPKHLNHQIFNSEFFVLTKKLQVDDILYTLKMLYQACVQQRLTQRFRNSQLWIRTTKYR
jgi:hypothetical protein